jgi:hypothetical protein
MKQKLWGALGSLGTWYGMAYGYGIICLRSISWSFGRWACGFIGYIPFERVRNRPQIVVEENRELLVIEMVS